MMMWHDIINFKKLDGYCLELEFDNGRRGTVDLSSYAGRGRGRVLCRPILTWVIQRKFLVS